MNLSFPRFVAVLRKELIQARRDRFTLALMLGMPLVQLFLFGRVVHVSRGRPAPGRGRDVARGGAVEAADGERRDRRGQQPGLGGGVGCDLAHTLLRRIRVDAGGSGEKPKTGRTR